MPRLASFLSVLLTFCDGSETLLPCSIPDLKLATLLVDHDLLDFEVDSKPS